MMRVSQRVEQQPSDVERPHTARNCARFATFSMTGVRFNRLWSRNVCIPNKSFSTQLGRTSRITLVSLQKRRMNLARMFHGFGRAAAGSISRLLSAKKTNALILPAGLHCTPSSRDDSNYCMLLIDSLII